MRVWSYYEPIVGHRVHYVEVAVFPESGHFVLRYDRPGPEMLFSLRASGGGALINFTIEPGGDLRIEASPSELYLKEIDTYALFNKDGTHLDEVAWVLDALGVVVDPNVAADADQEEDDEDGWNTFTRLAYSDIRVEGSFTMSAEEVELYQMLGESIPFLWPSEKLVQWAMEQPNAKIYREERP